jgi:hypothetical protein
MVNHGILHQYRVHAGGARRIEREEAHVQKQQEHNESGGSRLKSNEEGRRSQKMPHENILISHPTITGQHDLQSA